MAKVTLAPPFRYTGSGALYQLNHCGFLWSPSPIDALLPKTYFHAFYERVRGEFHTLPESEKLIIQVAYPDRLFRPLRFDSKDAATYEPLNEDIDFFREFLRVCFGERASDLVFLSLHRGDWRSVKLAQSLAGQIKGLGGRPPKRQSNRHTPQPIKLAIVLKAVRENWFSPQLKERLKAEHRQSINDHSNALALELIGLVTNETC